MHRPGYGVVAGGQRLHDDHGEPHGALGAGAAGRRDRDGARACGAGERAGNVAGGPGDGQAGRESGGRVAERLAGCRVQGLHGQEHRGAGLQVLHAGIGERHDAAGRLAGECPRAVGGAQPGRPVIAGLGVAQVLPVRLAAAVGAGCHVVQVVPGAPVQVGGRVRAGRRGPRQRVHRRDDRCRHARAAHHRPAGLVKGVVKGHAGVRVGHRGHVVLRPVEAAAGGGVVRPLPGRLRIGARAPRARAAPCRLGPAPGGTGIPGQGGAADRGHVLGR